MPFDSMDFSNIAVPDINSKQGKLLHLIEVLKNVPVDKFDMKIWRCGTSACAAGWAGLDPVFNCMGFISSLHNKVYYRPNVNIYNVGLFACMVFFELSDKQANHIFLPATYDSCNYITPNDVISRIEQLLEEEKTNAV